MHIGKFLVYMVCSFVCSCSPGPTTSYRLPEEPHQFTQYSKAVKDSFSIQVQTPLAYKDSLQKTYPVVVLLDANFHFPMLAASIRQYEQGGLLPPLILVGVGYKTFKEMDSLRVRDYLYPAALPSDEIKAIGGGERFRQFVTNELLPSIDSTFRTTTQNRSLLGHSFGGYFTLYSLLNQTTSQTNTFQNFVAASPSIWYHNFYVNQLQTKQAALSQKDSIHLFLSVGGLENPVWDVKPMTDLTNSLKKSGIVQVQGNVYNQLGHMDTGQLSFLKGLQEFYQ